MDYSVLMGLGRGLENFGQSWGQSIQERQRREEAERLRREERERSDRAMDNLLSQFALQQGLEDADQMQARASGLEAASMATSVMPGLAGRAFDPLSQLAKQTQDDMARGRRVSLTDSQGRTRNYVQPFSRSAEGRTEMERTRLAGERSKTVERLRAAGFDDAQSELLADAGSSEIAQALLDRLKPQTPRTQFDPESGKIIDLNTGTSKPVQGVAPRPKPAPGVETANQRAFQRESGLAGEYQRNPVIQDAYGIANAASQIQALARDVQNPQGDLDIIYQVVKLRDPGSVVREGEIDLQRAARSVGTQIETLWKKAKSGRMLTPQERQQIVGLVGVKLDAVRQRVAPIQADFGARSRKWGADSSFVAPDPLAGARGNPY